MKAEKRELEGDISSMNRFTRKSIISVCSALALVLAVAGIMLVGDSGAARAARASSPTTTKSHFCAGLGTKYQASQAAQMYCYGSQPNGPAKPVATKNPSFGNNVDAANPAEDVSPNGTRAYGQSEESVAGLGPYVVEAWNDATGFFAPCPSPMSKEELTGFAFSTNGGKSFTDLGGLPNTNCANFLYQGDPSVEVWKAGGTTYFYISSLFNPTFSNTTEQRSFIAMAACRVNGSGSSAQLSCSQPIYIAASSQCESFSGFTFCSFLDKDFLSIDPVHGRLYNTYTEFGVTGATIEEVGACDIGTPTGGAGPAGGTPGAPVCFNGSTGSPASPSAPYFVVNPGDPNFCENEGQYPAVNVATGDLYTAYEHNWATNIFSSACFGANEPVQNVMNYIPFSCLTLPAASCAAPAATNAASVISMDAAFIPGYNRFPMNDFPRLAVSSPAGTVSMVWNDARLHPAGDILMQSFNLVSLAGVTNGPIRVNSSTGGWHMLPALRNANSSGNLTISFYGRSSANSAVTNVYAAVNVNPRVTHAIGSNTLVTTGASNWDNVSSDIVPNFGDYTDNYVIATTFGTHTGVKVYIAWADGRLGVPQPFEAPVVS